MKLIYLIHVGIYQIYLSNFDNLEIVHLKKYSYDDMINNNLKLYKHLYTVSDFKIFDNDIRKYGLKPDGGILLLNHYDNNDLIRSFPLLLSEMKKQGTNDEKDNEKQALGNAIERLARPFNYSNRLLTCNEDISINLGFCYGCDFTEPYILGKLLSLSPIKLNNINVFKNKFGIGDTIYCREKRWGEDEILEIVEKILKLNLNYYLQKYFGKSIE